MFYVGLDLSRKKVDYCAMRADGVIVATGARPADADGLSHLVRDLDPFGEPVTAVVESMNGARFCHDRLELAGWEVEIAIASSKRPWARELSEKSCAKHSTR
jgi:transposase